MSWLAASYICSDGAAGPGNSIFSIALLDCTSERAGDFNKASEHGPAVRLLISTAPSVAKRLGVIGEGGAEEHVIATERLYCSLYKRLQTEVRFS